MRFWWSDDFEMTLGNSGVVQVKDTIVSTMLGLYDEIQFTRVNDVPVGQEVIDQLSGWDGELCLKVDFAPGAFVADQPNDVQKVVQARRQQSFNSNLVSYHVICSSHDCLRGSSFGVNRRSKCPQSTTGGS